MRIPFFKPSIGPREIEGALAVLQSGWLTTGRRCVEFEEKFSQFVGEDVFAIAVNSATAGLHLAGEACGIGPGDAVLAPTLTFSATAAAFHHLGAEIILVDIESGSHSIDLEDAERKYTPNCKAIVPVHFGGWPCDLAAVHAFARRRGLKVIEDAAHALPAGRDGSLMGGSDSDATVFSFYANKTITTGEGGMLTTRDPKIAARVRVMRTHGLDRDAFDRFKRVGASWSYDIVAPGFKYNMPDLAASIGIAQLERAYELQRGRELAAYRYLDRLGNLPLDCPLPAPRGGLHAWHLFPIRIHPDARVGRDALIERMTEQGIGTSVHYRPLHQMSYWSKSATHGNAEFTNADQYFEGALTLPLFPGMTMGQVDEVADVVRTALE